MPAHVEETVQLLALLQAKHRQEASRSQRMADRVTAIAGRPAVPAVIGCGAVLWIVANASLSVLNLPVIDAPPFSWLELALTVTALIMAALILVTQRNTDKLADIRAMMNLEITLLTEQKVAKLIGLVEELRRDSPHLRNRVDSEAHDMSTRADPQAVLVAINAVDNELRRVDAELSDATAGQ